MGHWEFIIIIIKIHFCVTFMAKHKTQKDEPKNPWQNDIKPVKTLWGFFFPLTHVNYCFSGNISILKQIFTDKLYQNGVLNTSSSPNDTDMTLMLQ